MPLSSISIRDFGISSMIPCYFLSVSRMISSWGGYRIPGREGIGMKLGIYFSNITMKIQKQVYKLYNSLTFSEVPQKTSKFK